MPHCFRNLPLWLLLFASVCSANIEQQWNFDHHSDREGWTVPADMGGVVMGGSLWLTLTPGEHDPANLASARFQVYGSLFELSKSPVPFLVTSPSGLDLAASPSKQWQVRLRVLNLSPVTDLSIAWRTAGGEWGKWGDKDKPLRSQRCALQSDIKEWQELSCYLGKDASAPIDQIGILITQRIRGDLWIDRLELVQGAPEPERVRPDLASARVVPQISLPGISQAGFEDAFKVLDKTMIVDVPMHGFPYPFNSPGGYYTEQGWWPLDSAIALVGARWANPLFAENVMRGWRAVQRLNPDGRIDLWGNAAVRGQPADQSILPTFFEVAYGMARRTSDLELRSEIYQTMKDYLDWWLSPVKRDARTGLVWATFEDSLSGATHMSGLKGFPEIGAQTIAATDTNVAVAIGAHYVARLAAELGQTEQAHQYQTKFASLSESINRYLWDEQQGAYYNYDLKKGAIDPGLSITTFNPLRLQIAPKARRGRLLQRLLDPKEFNWGKRPLTSRAMTDPSFVEARGNYDGRAWFGNIWPSHNAMVVEGLEDSERPDLAAELNWATINEFHGNYREYLLPSTGEGQGAVGYAWTASLYIGMLIEHLFGVDYDAIQKQIRITPYIPKSLYGKEIRLAGLILPTGQDSRLSVRIRQRSASSAVIQVDLIGTLPQGELEVTLPGTAKSYRVPVKASFTAKFE